MLVHMEASQSAYQVVTRDLFEAMNLYRLPIEDTSWEIFLDN